LPAVAQTKRRRRKRRGTQGGSIDRRGRAGRPRSRAEARARTKRQMQDRRDLPPTWRSAVGRAAFGALLFLALLVVAFKRPIAEAVALAAFMAVVYIPMGYYLEMFFYRRRQARRQRPRE
jgi:hypothetical protein